MKHPSPVTQLAIPLRQQGAVLITSLIFLTVLTLIGVVSMQSTSMDYQMSTNAVLRDRAFYFSENGRQAMGSVLDDHLFERGWTGNVILPTGLAIADISKDLYNGNDSSESLANSTSLTVDATHQLDGNGDGDVTDGEDSNSAIIVYKTQTQWAAGAGTAMAAGYEGLGKAAAAGGVHVFFELRSRGTSIAGAQATTAAEYRAILKN